MYVDHASRARRIDMQCVLNFTRFFGGPIHMMMRRYRFVEEGMTIGKQEDLAVVEQTRSNFKLWNRVDAKKAYQDENFANSEEGKARYRAELKRYEEAVARSDELMFRGLREFLEEGGDGHCDSCRYRDSYGAEAAHVFGGVELCDGCKPAWRSWLLSFPERAADVFPELVDVYRQAIVGPVVGGKTTVGAAPPSPQDSPPVSPDSEAEGKVRRTGSRSKALKRKFVDVRTLLSKRRKA